MASAQNTLIVLDSTTIATNIKPDYIAELIQCSKVTGKSFSRLLNEAVNDFMEMKAPVYMDEADRRKGKPIPIPAGFRSNGDGTISNLAFPPVRAKAKRRQSRRA